MNFTKFIKFQISKKNYLFLFIFYFLKIGGKIIFKFQFFFSSQNRKIASADVVKQSIKKKCLKEILQNSFGFIQNHVPQPAHRTLTWTELCIGRAVWNSPHPLHYIIQYLQPHRLHLHMCRE